MRPDERFWAKVDAGDPMDCWVYRGSGWNGYGHFYLDGRSVKAHRYAYERFPLSKPKASWESIDAEVAKCDVLCRACSGRRAQALQAVSA